MFALLIIALGVVLLGDNLDLFEGRDLLHVFWPAAFVLIGLVVLIEPRRHGGSGRIMGVIVGGMLISMYLPMFKLINVISGG